MATVGVCEDDPAIRRVIVEGLRLHGHDVAVARSGSEALELFGSTRALDVVVLDIGLPDSDGRDVFTALRAAGQTAPVLFLTALGRIHDKLAGFAAGADDYLTKPFELAELLARVEALARRVPASPAAQAAPAGLALDPTRHAVVLGGNEAALTPTEFRMLAAIMSRPGQVVRRRQVVAAAWPDGAQVSESTVDSYVSRIRRKLERIGSPLRVHSVRGVGFELR